ncbi:MAG: GTP cyclohydrolase I FolE2 [Oxalobacter sp.]|nr:GTP cyclohydrolase I FolE2 [Oxalobacter sp.]
MSCAASGNPVNPVSHAIPDIQNTLDTRKIAIQKVGVKGVKHPLRVQSRDGIQPSVGTWNMYVHLPDHQKGTHMSRFIDLLEIFTSLEAAPLDFNVFTKLIYDMLDMLNAESGMIEVLFPFFMTKAAPVTGVKSVMNYEVGMKGEIVNGRLETTLSAQVPVTSLCPCSKEISAYGAHNQRSHITVQAVLNELLPIEELIANIEAQASCELFGLLKRPDEKYVTEHAYDNPKFVEDLVRDVAGMLNADSRIAAYSLEAENFESIHNHSAYAFISYDKRNK